ncbi:MAG: DUF1553 domain-containing protein [Planctomycetes bacterium]|nr:DUF1553 domain-containing protein [Planctomycetota bacterium]
MRALYEILLVLGALADAPPNTGVDYLKDIKPLFRERCYACHGALKQESGLRLDTVAFMIKGGTSGSVLVPKKFDKSLLFHKVSDHDASLRMPPEGRSLEPGQIEKIKTWIINGALAPSDEMPEKDALLHWAFQKIPRPNIPLPKHPGVSNNPIDLFLASKLEGKGLQMQSPAEKQILLRRVFLDLVGIPPTLEQIDAFLADPSPDAYEKIVDLLLSDPRHGERWARHWMDIWRYADWHGRRYVQDVWNSAPQIWRWRDWIVDSLNSNKGYDQMIHEMLAGDEFFPMDQSSAHATGYLVRNWYALNPNDWMRSIVEHTGKAFLGLTFNCAHCHDHKYDPITHEDYFKFRAFFEPIGLRQDREPGEADPGPFQEYDYSKLRAVQRLGSVRVYDKNLNATTKFYTGGDERNLVKEKSNIQPGVPAFLSGFMGRIEPITLPINSWYPGSREHVQKSVILDAQNNLQKAEMAYAEKLETKKPTPQGLLDALKKAEMDHARILQEVAKNKLSGALSGSRSLIFDSTTGRRVLYNSLASLKSLEEGSLIEFKLMILADAHFNFQLVKDFSKGLTAGYVGFEKGRIISYKPGSFVEFDVGSYDLTKGQNTFLVQLEIRPKSDQCLLSIRSIPEEKTILQKVSVALNQWNPVGNQGKGILFDARTKSKAAIDDFNLYSPEHTKVVSFDFENSPFASGKDIVGIQGWESSQMNSAGARSFVSETDCNPSLQASFLKLENARNDVRKAEAPLLVAELELEAARAELKSVEARIKADVEKFAVKDQQKSNIVVLEASTLEKKAAVLRAEADLAKAEILFQEAKDQSPPKVAKELEVLSKKIAAAKSNLEKANTVRANPKASQDYTLFSPVFPEKSSGRRKALALWITDRNNPLAARVAVNHIWTRHFHNPLVSSVADFGRNGKAPSHPELLDWLASELLDNGWNMKHLHKLMVTSHAYKQNSSSSENTKAQLADPENIMLWHKNTGRMEAEVVRDSIFHLSGKLSQQMKGQELENEQAFSTFKRSLYYSTYPEDGGKSKLSELFDAPDTLDCYRRTRTIIPQQALALTNSVIIHEASGSIEKEIWGQVSNISSVDGSHDAFINLAFKRVLGRSPTPAESSTCKTFLAKSDFKDRAALIRVLFNHNDFVTIR